MIRAIQFSSLAPEVKNLFPFIESDKRFGNCYDFTYNISLNLGVPNQIVTGYIYMDIVINQNFFIVGLNLI